MSFPEAPFNKGHDQHLLAKSDGIEVAFGEQTLRLDPTNTFIRRFMSGNGSYDYCVHLQATVDADGFPDTDYLEFQPHAELLGDMEALGIKAHLLVDLDKPAAVFLTRLRRQEAAEQVKIDPPLHDKSMQDVENLLMMDGIPPDIEDN